MVRKIETFCFILGQRINLKKSQIICAENLNWDVANFLFHEKGFSHSSQDIHYLGFPNFPFLKNARTTAPLHKICYHPKNRIQNWKFRNLSQVGKVVRMKSVLLAFPTYLMSCYKFSKGLIYKIHKMLQSFWKNQSEENKKQVSWDFWKTLCLDKNQGGLVMRNQVALLSKLGWRLVSLSR